MDLYAENILEHYRHPLHKELMENVTQHTEKNPSCGDEITIGLKIEDDVVTKITWNGDGCAISQAAMSMLSDEYTGKTCDELLRLRTGDITNMLGVPISPRRLKCALLCLHTLHNTIKVYQQQKLQPWKETLEKN